MSERSLLRSTLRALLTPRRLIPIVGLAVPLVMAQQHYSNDPLALPLGVAMCLAFVLLAPVSWRALFRGEDRTRRTFTEPFGRIIVFGVAGAGTVWIVGSLVPGLLGIRPTFLTSDASLLVATALFLVGGHGLGRDIELERSLQHARARVETLAHEAERAQLLALKNHLDPHFLFNTLNAIAEWCREDGETAERATLELAAMLRVVMDATRIEAWPLQQELDLADTLIDLHRIRDPDRFKLVREVPESMPDLTVPPMVLLPLVENAIKHGPAASHRGELVLRVRTEDGHVEFSIANPGAFAGPRVGGEGLELVRKRLMHAYGDAAHFEIGPDPQSDTRTLATVRIAERSPKVNV